MSSLPQICAVCAGLFHNHGHLPHSIGPASWQVDGDVETTPVRSLHDAIAAASLQPSGHIYTSNVGRLSGEILASCVMAGITLCATHAATYSHELLSLVITNVRRG